MSTLKNMIFYFIILLNFFSCSKQEESPSNGFVLQEFKIVEPSVKKAASNLTLFALKDIKRNNNLSMVLVLKQYDSIPEFWFNLVDSENISSFISLNNLRVVGYLNINKTDVILLSNIQNRINFEFAFYKFIHPTTLHKKFKNVIFDENQYVIGKDNKPVLPTIPRDNYIIYILKNGKMIRITDEYWGLKRLQIDIER